MEFISHVTESFILSALQATIIICLFMWLMRSCDSSPWNQRKFFFPLWQCFILYWICSYFFLIVRFGKQFVKVCSKTGSNMNDLLDLFKFRSLEKAQQILNEPSHPLWSGFIMVPSGRRLKSHFEEETGWRIPSFLLLLTWLIRKATVVLINVMCDCGCKPVSPPEGWWSILNFN